MRAPRSHAVLVGEDRNHRIIEIGQPLRGQAEDVVLDDIQVLESRVVVRIVRRASVGGRVDVGRCKGMVEKAASRASRRDAVVAFNREVFEARHLPVDPGKGSREFAGEVVGVDIQLVLP